MENLKLPIKILKDYLKILKNLSKYNIFKIRNKGKSPITKGGGKKEI